MGHIPPEMKTLSSVKLKIYKVALLVRCQDTIMKSLSKQQGGFQKQLDCQMSTFVLLKRSTMHVLQCLSAV